MQLIFLLVHPCRLIQRSLVC